MQVRLLPACALLLAMFGGAPAAWAQSPSSAVLSNPDAIRVLLSAQTETTLVAQMMGQIETLNASLGGAVKKGQTLVAFDCAEAQARLHMAQAERDSAQETLSVKSNLRKLDAAGDLEVSLARTELRRSEAAVAMGNAQAAQCKVLAPFDGRVVKTHVKPFQGVNAGAPLLELVSSGALKIRLNVPSRLLAEIKPGTPFSVEIDEIGRSYSAQVTAINGRVDAVAQTIELEGRLDEVAAELLPGMSGVARFVKGTPEPS
jgi:membrane fusion protein (multidrug efflux system)